MANVQTSTKVRKDSLFMPDDLEGTFVEHSFTLKDSLAGVNADENPAK